MMLSDFVQESINVELLSTSFLGLFNQQKLIKGQTRNSGKALLGLTLQHKGGKNETGDLAFSLKGDKLVP